MNTWQVSLAPLLQTRASSTRWVTRRPRHMLWKLPSKRSRVSIVRSGQTHTSLTLIARWTRSLSRTCWSLLMRACLCPRANASNLCSTVSSGHRSWKYCSGSAMTSKRHSAFWMACVWPAWLTQRLSFSLTYGQSSMERVSRLLWEESISILPLIKELMALLIQTIATCSRWVTSALNCLAKFCSHRSNIKCPQTQ